jgi:hypothetical protein
LEGLAGQELAPGEVIVVDNGSTDGSQEYLRADHARVRLICLAANAGFAHAANIGLDAARGELVALINTDVVLAADWLRRTAQSLREHPDAASVACKMLSLERPELVYDAGDVLRRDGVCEQRGRFGLDDGRWDQPEEVFGACAGAALYRRAAVIAAGGFDERYFAYLEDVDLALRLRLAGWGCRYEPAVALHAGEGSSYQLPGGHRYLVERNTLLLVARFFPLRWLPMVIYRQASWLAQAARERRLAAHVHGAAAGLVLGLRAAAERRRLRGAALIPIETAVPTRPFRGWRAGGHPDQIAAILGQRGGAAPIE